MSAPASAQPQVGAASPEPLWFLGTLARLKLTGEQTGGRFALWEGVLPHGAAPPLHSHPQDETLVLLEGRLTAWVVPPGTADDGGVEPGWLETRGRPHEVGGVVFAPAGVPHTFRVESDTARMMFLSTPAGIEDYVRALAEPARWPWLQPPPDRPRVSAERLREVEQELGVVRHGPPPPVG